MPVMVWKRLLGLVLGLSLRALHAYWNLLALCPLCEEIFVVLGIFGLHYFALTGLFQVDTKN